MLRRLVPRATVELDIRRWSGSYPRRDDPARAICGSKAGWLKDRGFYVGALVVRHQGRVRVWSGEAARR